MTAYKVACFTYRFRTWLYQILCERIASKLEVWIPSMVEYELGVELCFILVYS